MERPAELLAVELMQLRAAGLSWRKIETLRDLAERLSDGWLDEEAMAALPDDDFIAALTEISGIGPWTAQGVRPFRSLATSYLFASAFDRDKTEA